MTFAQRLWIYQAERFPLAKTVPLLACFSAASITLSAVLGGRAVPGLGAYVVGFALALILFFQMRVADEIKDSADDALYRPDRPIPRGLISLRTIVICGAATVPVGLVLALWLGSGVIWLLLVVWAWLLMMSFEFGAPAWLKARPVIYLVSHMAIMPLIDLLLTGVEWTRHGGAASALWLFIVLSFTNGCVLEIGRKLWAPENEIEGVDTYSGLWGPQRAAHIWIGVVWLSACLLIGVGHATGYVVIFTLLAVAAAGLCSASAIAYARNPNEKTQKRQDTLSGLWVFFCYATAGFLPVLLGGWP